MGKKIVADDLAALHDESDALAFGDVGEFPGVIARTMPRAGPRAT